MTSLQPRTKLDEVLALDPGGPRVTAVGGGHGLAQVLSAAQTYASSIDGVVTVADDGGSSGRLTRALDILPPGDLRRCLLALSPAPSLFRELFEFRFERSDVAGHSLGNLVLAALSDLFGDFDTALNVAAGALGAVGRVIPASRTTLHLQAVIDGRMVDGQAAVTKARGSITEIRLIPPDEPAHPQALEAIARADQVVIGPGSLFTSVISALLVPGLTEAINASTAQKVFVCNITTQDGETLGMDAADHVQALIRFAGLATPFTVVANTHLFEIPAPQDRVRVNASELRGLGVEPELVDLVDPTADWPEHDTMRLGRVLARLWADREAPSPLGHGAV